MNNVWKVATLFNKYPNLYKIEYKEIKNSGRIVEVNEEEISPKLWVASIHGDPKEMDEFRSLCVEINLSPDEGLELISQIDNLNFDDLFCLSRGSINDYLALDVFSISSEIKTIEAEGSGQRNKVMVNGVELDPFLFVHILSGEEDPAAIPEEFKSFCIETGLNQSQALKMVNLLSQLDFNKSVHFKRKNMLGFLVAKEAFRFLEGIQYLEFSHSTGLLVNSSPVPRNFFFKEIGEHFGKPVSLDEESQAWLVEQELHAEDVFRLISLLFKIADECRNESIPVPAFSFRRGEAMMLGEKEKH